MPMRPTVQQVHVNRPLSQISVAYRNDAYIADQVFPIVPVDKKSDLYFVFGKGAWFRNRSGPRAPGTRAPVGDYDISTASYICYNDSIAKLIPDEVRNNSDVPLRPDVTAVNFVTDGLLLGLEARVAAVITACANWTSASNPSVLWSSDSSDPFADIDNAVNAVVTQTSRYPNVAVCSWNVWKRLRNHPAFLERIKYARPGGKVELGDLQSWFGLDKILVGRAIQETAKEGATSSQSFIWGNHFWVGYVTPSAALEEPSAGYIFRWGNREVSRFRLQPEHSDLVEAQWWTSEQITASDAGAIMATVL